MRTLRHGFKRRYVLFHHSSGLLMQQMLAGEVKTDRKIDIVARMTPAANRTYREVTSSPFTEEGESMLSAADTTEVEESFTSALDASAMSSPQSTGVRQTRLSDPFMVTPPSTARVVPTVMITRESGATDLQEEREVSQDLEDIDSDGEGVEATEVSLASMRLRHADGAGFVQSSARP